LVTQIGNEKFRKRTAPVVLFIASGTEMIFFKNSATTLSTEAVFYAVLWIKNVLLRIRILISKSSGSGFGSDLKYLLLLQKYDFKGPKMAFKTKVHR
jgi:hypothetical protein